MMKTGCVTDYRLERHDEGNQENGFGFPHSRHRGFDVVPLRKPPGLGWGRRLPLSANHGSVHRTAYLQGPVSKYLQTVFRVF